MALVLFFFRALRGTAFSLSLSRGYLGGIFVFREIFVLVLLGVVLFGVFGSSYFDVVHVLDSEIHFTGAIVFFCVALLILFISFWSQTVFKKYLVFDRVFSLGFDNFPLYIKSLTRSVALLLFVCIFLAHATGMSHAFIKSIFFSQDLMSVRLSNRYSSSTPGHVVMVIKFSYVFLCLLISFFRESFSGKLEKFFYFVLVVYAATLPGDKAPIVQVLILIFVCYIVLRRVSPVKILFVGGVSTLFVFLLVYILVTVQYPDISTEGFFWYLLNRLGVGQIQGVYEQFSLELRDWRYMLVEVPFSGLFVDPPNYSKDLMLNTLGRDQEFSEVGVMNSFFIGQAYAIGGLPFVFVSPLLVAFNYCLINFFVILFLVRLFGFSRSHAQLLGVIFCSSVVMFTGDLNGLLLGKKIFIIAFYFVLVFLVFRFFRFSLPLKKGGAG
ncbi:hypothetical protein [Marinobacter nauticus]|nr:hypothetical protein [Marinobacter nauticus]